VGVLNLISDKLSLSVSDSDDISLGCVYLISMYYKRYELQWRMSLFFSASILAGAFSGLLAFAIANMAGVGGYGAWRCKPGPTPAGNRLMLTLITL
jgi:hypothetical protein